MGVGLSSIEDFIEEVSSRFPVDKKLLEALVSWNRSSHGGRAISVYVLMNYLGSEPQKSMTGLNEFVLGYLGGEFRDIE